MKPTATQLSKNKALSRVKKQDGCSSAQAEYPIMLDSGNANSNSRTQYFRVIFITYYCDQHSERGR